MFQSIDDWLFDKFFQKISDWVEKMFGINCFWLARLFYCLAAIAFTAGILPSSWKNIILMILVILGLVGYMIISYLTEQIFYDQSVDNQAVSNHQRVSPGYIFLRFLALVVAILFTSIFLLIFFRSKEVNCLFGTIIFPAITAGFYFQACTPLPPAKSRVREFLEVFKTILIWQKASS